MPSQTSERVIVHVVDDDASMRGALQLRLERTEGKRAMVRTRQPGEAAIRLDRSERIYWRPFTVSLIKAKVRTVVKLMQHGHLETIMFDGFYIGLGDRFDDDRRSVRRKLSSR